MLRSNKTTQFDGTSYITDGEGNEQTVAYFKICITRTTIHFLTKPMRYVAGTTRDMTEKAIPTG